jgi:CRP/FNR family transcriptional regulator, cyclic AMP receptor protein
MLLKNFLRTLPGFQFMSDEDLDHLAAAMRVEDYPDKHVFVYQDKLARELFLLLEGQVKVCHYGRSGRYHTIKTLAAGEFFGLLSLSDGKPSEVSCAAMGPVKVASLPFSAYVLLYQPGSSIGCSFQYVVAAQLARQLRDRHSMLRNLLAQIYGGAAVDQPPPCAMPGPAGKDSAPT